MTASADVLWCRIALLERRIEIMVSILNWNRYITQAIQPDETLYEQFCCGKSFLLNSLIVSLIIASPHFSHNPEQLWRAEEVCPSPHCSEGTWQTGPCDWSIDRSTEMDEESGRFKVGVQQTDQNKKEKKEKKEKKSPRKQASRSVRWERESEREGRTVIV